MEDGFKMISSMFGGFETRIKGVESFLNSHGCNERGDFGGDDYSPRTRVWTQGDCSGGGGGQKDVVEASNEPVAEASKEPVAEATNEPVAEATNEPMAEALKEPVAEASKEPEDQAEVGEKRVKKRAATLRTPYMAQNPAKKGKKN
ncbi:unnamed protein product [Arabis nemorensis]|uniref:Uncharacterized protein n=1 Tax=Arabis nemorensis TaxID=586526 RepID=A0A565BQY1_9BRAS|nr:unnamed protein product [Arabis nemorensis]